jgi:hypothetical protein
MRPIAGYLNLIGACASLLNRAHEQEIIQPEDERERATNEDVLHHSAPAVEIHAVHLHSLHGRVNAPGLHH